MHADSVNTVMGLTANPDTLDVIAKLAVALISIVNLLVVLYIFRSTRRFSQLSIVVEKKSIWFRELAIQPNLERINQFYKGAQVLLETAQSEILGAIHVNREHNTILTLSQAKVGQFNGLLVEIRKDFIDILAAMDENFGKSLYAYFDELQDQVIPKFEELLSKGDQCKCDFRSVLTEHRLKLFQMLYNYEVVDLLGPIVPRKRTS